MDSEGARIGWNLRQRIVAAIGLVLAFGFVLRKLIVPVSIQSTARGGAVDLGSVGDDRHRRIIALWLRLNPTELGLRVPRLLIGQFSRHPCGRNVAAGVSSAFPAPLRKVLRENDYFFAVTVPHRARYHRRCLRRIFVSRIRNYCSNPAYREPLVIRAIVTGRFYGCKCRTLWLDFQSSDPVRARTFPHTSISTAEKSNHRHGGTRTGRCDRPDIGSYGFDEGLI